VETKRIIIAIANLKINFLSFCCNRLFKILDLAGIKNYHEQQAVLSGDTATIGKR
jgi:hypothetical protein